MRELLSIAAAAQQCPDITALSVGGQAYSYHELASLCADIELSARNVHRAGPTLATALRLYASLDRSAPLSLLPAGKSGEDTQGLEAIAAPLDSATALVLFTSGSTGVSKAVALSRSALVASAQLCSARVGLETGDRWFCCLPLWHVGGLSILIRCLVSRSTAILSDGFDVGVIREALEDGRASHISLVPTMLWRLLEADTRPSEGLRVALIGGAAIDPSLARRARAAGFRLELSYGMTETCSMVICDGRPLPGVQVRVKEGRLEIRSPTLMSGYLGAPLRDAADASPWFRTDDSAEIDDDGRVRILCRADDAIISGGENIDPRAVEAALNRDPRVVACHALGVAHPEWGQALVALIVPRDADAKPQEWQFADLSGHNKPKAFIPVAHLPLLGNGKVDVQQAQSIAEAWMVSNPSAPPGGFKNQS